MSGAAANARATAGNNNDLLFEGILTKYGLVAVIAHGVLLTFCYSR